LILRLVLAKGIFRAADLVIDRAGDGWGIRLGEAH